MSTAAQNPQTTPIPVQLSEPEFTEFIFPHLSMPKRGPRCKIGSLNLSECDQNLWDAVGVSMRPTQRVEHHRPWGDHW
jgi:hypothetical protein